MPYPLPLVNEDTFYSFEEAEISLTAAQIAEAVRISEPVIDRELQWQAYLSSLALAGFTSWLDERDDELTIDTSQCPLLTGSPTIGAASRLQIGGFKVCVIAKGGLDGDYVNIPQAILKDPAETAQFYIFVEVLEEMSQAVMYGFLRSDRLEQYFKTEPLEDFSDGTCDLPISWLNLEFDELVSYLRCFNPSAIPLPQLVIQNRQLNSSDAQISKFKGCWKRIFNRNWQWGDLGNQIRQQIDLLRNTRSTLYWQGSLCSYLVSLWHDYINFG
jgi:Protein of unknown function (DUF1822)